MATPNTQPDAGDIAPLEQTALERLQDAFDAADGMSTSIVDLKFRRKIGFGQKLPVEHQ